MLRGIKDAKQYLGRAWTKFFVHDGIPAYVADSAYFKKAIEATQECGTGVRAPKSHEIYNKYLPMEVGEIENHIKNFHSHWDDFGCTIMCDGWTSNNKRNIINFLVYCTEGMVFLKSVDATNNYKIPNFC